MFVEIDHHLECAILRLILHLFLEVGLVLAQLLLADNVRIAASVHGRRGAAIGERIQTRGRENGVASARAIFVFAI